MRMYEKIVKRAKNFIKFRPFLYPIRKLAGRFVIIEKYDGVTDCNGKTGGLVTAIASNHDYMILRFLKTPVSDG